MFVGEAWETVSPSSNMWDLPLEAQICVMGGAALEKASFEKVPV